MFFFIAKTLGAMAHGPMLLLELLFFGVVLMWTRWRRAGRTVTTSAAVLIALFSLTGLPNLLAWPIENRFPQPKLVEAPTGVIVLGGSMDEGVTRARGQPSLNDAAERLTEAVALSRRYPNARIVFTGGSGRLTPAEITEADVARDFFLSLGVAPERITLENRSRDTWENAAFTKELVQPKPDERWLLVTSAVHMPRSVGIFRKVGFPVIPYPVDYMTGGTWGELAGIKTPASMILVFERVTHEWIGLATYWLTGKSSELFPGP